MPSVFNSFCLFQQIEERNNGCLEYALPSAGTKIKKGGEMEFLKPFKKSKFLWIGCRLGGTFAMTTAAVLTSAASKCLAVPLWPGFATLIFDEVTSLL